MTICRCVADSTCNLNLHLLQHQHILLTVDDVQLKPVSTTTSICTTDCWQRATQTCVYYNINLYYWLLTMCNSNLRLLQHQHILQTVDNVQLKPASTTTSTCTTDCWQCATQTCVYYNINIYYWLLTMCNSNLCLLQHQHILLTVDNVQLKPVSTTTSTYTTDCWLCGWWRPSWLRQRTHTAVVLPTLILV